MVPFQVWLEATLASFDRVGHFMHLTWSWPLVESAHFIGLTLLLGSIGAWDLRLLGLANDVPIAAFHRLIPFAVLGFAINAATGTMFLMTEANQYVYNPAFQLKVLCLILAGVNVAFFYMASFRRIEALLPGMRPPPLARFAGGVSLALWISVIILGRMITFYRPRVCLAGEAVGFLSDCIVR
jgi:hypothetical protein